MRMSVRDGRLMPPDGTSYRLLVLPESRTMTPAPLDKLKELVEAGATILGPPPLCLPSLDDYPNATPKSGGWPTNCGATATESRCWSIAWERARCLGSAAREAAGRWRLAARLRRLPAAGLRHPPAAAIHPSPSGGHGHLFHLQPRAAGPDGQRHLARCRKDAGTVAAGHRPVRAGALVQAARGDHHLDASAGAQRFGVRRLSRRRGLGDQAVDLLRGGKSIYVRGGAPRIVVQKAAYGVPATPGGPAT